MNPHDINTLIMAIIVFGTSIIVIILALMGITSWF